MLPAQGTWLYAIAPEGAVGTLHAGVLSLSLEKGEDMSRRDRERRGSTHRVSTTQNVLSLLAVVSLLMLFAALVPAVRGAAAEGEPKDTSKECRANLKLIGLAVGMYQADHDELVPPSLQMLVDLKYIPGDRVKSILRCPASTATEEVDPKDVGKSGDYWYAPLKDSRVEAPGSTPIAWEKNAAHGGDVINVLFFDLHAQAMKVSRLAELLKENEDHNKQIPPDPSAPAAEGAKK